MWVYFAESAHMKENSSLLPLITSWHLENCQGFQQYVTTMLKMFPLKHMFFLSNIFFSFYSILLTTTLEDNQVSLIIFPFIERESRPKWLSISAVTREIGT